MTLKYHHLSPSGFGMGKTWVLDGSWRGLGARHIMEPGSRGHDGSGTSIMRDEGSVCGFMPPKLTVP